MTRITFWLRFKCVLLKQFRPCMAELSNKHKNPLDYTEMGLKSVSRRMTVTCGFNRRKRIIYRTKIDGQEQTFETPARR